MALPSLPTSGSVPSAGVAVAVRDRLGLRPPTLGAHEVVPNRVQHVLIDIPEMPVGLHAFN
eukprot:5441242-Pyramimonas_sp.AAC.1